MGAIVASFFTAVSASGNAVGITLPTMSSGANEHGLFGVPAREYPELRVTGAPYTND